MKKTYILHLGMNKDQLKTLENGYTKLTSVPFWGIYNPEGFEEKLKSITNRSDYGILVKCTMKEEYVLEAAAAASRGDVFTNWIVKDAEVILDLNPVELF